MREKYKELLDTIQISRKESDTTVSQMVEEYQNSVNIYEELSDYFEEDIRNFIANKKEILFDCLISSYDFEPSKLKPKKRRNLTLGIFFMALFEQEIEESEALNVPYQMEINDFNDLELFVPNRLADAHYIMEGIMYFKREKNIEDFFDEYTYLGIKKEASVYFGIDNNRKGLKK